MTQIIQAYYHRLYSFIIGCNLFILCVIPKFSTIGLLLLLLLTILGFINKKIKFQFNPITFLLVLLYIFYSIGLIWSDNLDVGLKSLEYKLSFIILPFLMMIKTDKKFPKNHVFLGLILGCFVASLYNFYQAFLCFKETGISSCFLSSNISTIVHPTYFSAYVTIAIVMIWLGYYYKFKWFNITNSLLFTLYFVVYIFMMMSLAGMLFLGLSLLSLVLVFLYKLLKIKGIILTIIITPISALLLYQFVPQVKNEIDDLVYYGKRYLDNKDNYFKSLYYPYSGTEARLIMWRISLIQIKEQPLGVGTGTLDKALEKQMKINGLDNRFIEWKLNPHNQFFQIFIEIGVFGLLIFVIFLSKMLMHSIKSKDYLLLIITINCFFNCMFESMFQRQSGIVFYTLIFCFLSIYTYQTKLNESK